MPYYIDRMKIVQRLKEEDQLRQLIRENLKKKKQQKRLNETKEENLLRNLVKLLIKEAANPVIYKSTGINVLDELLQKILPVVEKAYKQLTTDESQRLSFRAHLLNGIKQSLAPTKATANQKLTETLLMDEKDELDEDINITVGDNDEEQLSPDAPDSAEADKSKFIDIEKKDDEDEELKQYAIPGEDATGRNMFLDIFSKIETQIHDSFDLLDNSEDRELFYDYMIANIALYCDKWEDELKSEVEEPGSLEYDQEKDKTP